MALPKLAFRRQHTGDRVMDEAQRLAQRAAQAFNGLPDNPFWDGVQVLDQTITVGGTTVTHNLKRVPIGYIVTRVRSYSGAAAGPVVYDASGNPPSESTWLLFGANTTAQVDLWVF